MVQIAGTYEHVRNDNFVQYLITQGFSAEQAKQADSIKPKLKVTVEGNKVSLESDGGLVKTSPTYILNQEVDEPSLDNIVLKSIAKLEGDTLTITSRSAEGKTGYRTHHFSDTELVVTLTSEDSSVPTAKRFYKRV